MDRGAWWAAVHGGPKESDTKSRDMTGQLSTGAARVPSKLLTQKSCTVAQEHYPHFTAGHAQAQSNAMTLTLVPGCNSHPSAPLRSLIPIESLK